MELEQASEKRQTWMWKKEDLPHVFMEMVKNIKCIQNYQRKTTPVPCHRYQQKYKQTWALVPFVILWINIAKFVDKWYREHSRIEKHKACICAWFILICLHTPVSHLNKPRAIADWHTKLFQTPQSLPSVNKVIYCHSLQAKPLDVIKSMPKTWLRNRFFFDKKLVMLILFAILSHFLCFT